MMPSGPRSPPPVIKKGKSLTYKSIFPRVFHIEIKNFPRVKTKIYARRSIYKTTPQKEFMKNFSPDNFYHIYLRDKCVVSCISEEGFNETWTTLKAMVGLMKTDYSEDDLSYEMVSNPTMNFEEASY